MHSDDQIHVPFEQSGFMWRRQSLESVGCWQDKKMHQFEGAHSEHFCFSVLPFWRLKCPFFSQQRLHRSQMGSQNCVSSDSLRSCYVRTHLHRR